MFFVKLRVNERMFSRIDLKYEASRRPIPTINDNGIDMEGVFH